MTLYRLQFQIEPGVLKCGAFYLRLDYKITILLFQIKPTFFFSPALQLMQAKKTGKNPKQSKYLCQLLLN